MKTNSRRSSSNRRLLPFLSIAVVGILALFFFRQNIGTVASFVFHPITVTQLWIRESSGVIPSYLRTRQALIDEIQSLKTQLEEHTTDAVQIQALQAENTSLHSAFGLTSPTRLVARVLMHPNQTPYDTILIDRGTADAIKEGAVVYAQGDIAIGSIETVYAKSALVRLVSSPGTHTTAYIFGPNIFTTADGMGGGVLRVGVPQGIPFAIDDVVMLPGAGTGVYGTIVHIESSPSSPEQYGYVTTPVPLQTLRLVSVATDVVPEISYTAALEAVQKGHDTLFSVPVPEGVRIGSSTATTTVTSE